MISKRLSWVWSQASLQHKKSLTRYKRNFWDLIKTRTVLWTCKSLSKWPLPNSCKDTMLTGRTSSGNAILTETGSSTSKNSSQPVSIGKSCKTNKMSRLLLEFWTRIRMERSHSKILTIFSTVWEALPPIMTFGTAFCRKPIKTGTALSVTRSSLPLWAICWGNH